MVEKIIPTSLLQYEKGKLRRIKIEGRGEEVYEGAVPCNVGPFLIKVSRPGAGLRLSSPTPLFHV